MPATRASFFGLTMVAGIFGFLVQQPAMALGGTVVVSQTGTEPNRETSVVVTNAVFTSYTTQLPSGTTPSPFDYTLKLNPGTISPNIVTPTWNAGAGDPFYQYSGAGIDNSLVSPLGDKKIFNGTLDTTPPVDTSNNSRLFVYRSGKIEIQVSSTLNSIPECYTNVTVVGAVNTVGCAEFLNSLVLTLQTGKTGFVPDSAPGSLPTIASLLSDFTGTYTAATGSISTGAGEGVNNYSVTNTEVPGPLPVLGAGAAFGFSRRLRLRQRLSRSRDKAPSC